MIILIINDKEKSMLKKIISKYNNILIYGSISIGVTIIDVIVTYILKHFTLLVIANSAGVITGGIIQYILNSKFVFHVNKNTKNFGIYVLTFIFGLILANLIIYYSDMLFHYYIFNERLIFLLSKGLSIIIPFFALYFIRKGLYKKFN